MANIRTIDLNLLRVFDAIYRRRNVSQAAEELGLSQPSTSQALTRLRLILKDPLFERSGNGVRPTERARQMAQQIGLGLETLDYALRQGENFDPSRATDTVHLHLTDIGEARFLPVIMQQLEQLAPNMRVESKAWPLHSIVPALDAGELHFALGYIPTLEGCVKQTFLMDYYGLLMRNQHPFLSMMGNQQHIKTRLQELEFVAVHSHAVTLHILQSLQLEHRVRLRVSNFLALPDIVGPSDLVAIMPYDIAKGFSSERNCTVIDVGLPLRYFNVALHWSKRHEHKAMHSWFRNILLNLPLK
ncbi:LysR family transcriptional regulator [Paenalcaligenes hominis]|uniref:LysR family transcriptional regulator n=1 Tax=Paenalcaligenes hominis TaxID=643674 RepID=UPI0035235F1A